MSPSIFLSAKGTPNLANSWCFLKNVEDPKNPRKNCYGDIQYSEVDEKFWSSSACGAGLLLNKETAIGKGVFIYYMIAN